MSGAVRKRFWLVLGAASGLAVAVFGALLLWKSGVFGPKGPDFAKLQARNPEIYAWLSFPEAGVDHPVLQRQGASNDEEDEYYLTRDLDGNPSEMGCAFTQYRYNNRDFSDPVTVIYGHCMDDGTMFGSLQSWCQTARLGEESVFTIYLPGRRLTYQVFAGIPYDNSHVMYYHDFHSEQVFTKFFKDVFATRDFRAVLNPGSKPEYGDKVVILATCQQGDDTKRYLTMGVLIEDAVIAS